MMETIPLRAIERTARYWMNKLHRPEFVDQVITEEAERFGILPGMVFERTNEWRAVDARRSIALRLYADGNSWSPKAIGLFLKLSRTTVLYLIGKTSKPLPARWKAALD